MSPYYKLSIGIDFFVYASMGLIFLPVSVVFSISGISVHGMEFFLMEYGIGSLYSRLNRGFVTKVFMRNLIFRLAVLFIGAIVLPLGFISISTFKAII